MKKKFLYGGDYNPEQWLNKPDILDIDLQYMKEANINCVTLGMFSWSILEPKESIFNFKWLETILEKLEKNNIYVILGTPSGGKPNWLGKKYKETQIVNKNGIRELQGNRHNFCTNSPIYRKKVKIINEKLAYLSLKYNNIILWHISNEFGQNCYCDLCLAKFRKWLKHKYKTIDNLNNSWWTTFWSHKYNSFEEIDFPLNIGELSIVALNINYLQFMTQNFIDFFNFEKNTIKKINSKIPFTTNYHGTGNNNIDYRLFSKHVDIISYDSYPEWMMKNNVEVAYETSFMFDLIRSTDLKKPFLLMESSPSATNWQQYSKLKPPKLLELASLQAISHGSFGVLYFQIRQSRGSAEKFHGAVIGHDGSNKSRVFLECKHIGKKLNSMIYLPTKNTSKVGLYFSWNNKFALENSQGPRNKGMDYYVNISKIYKVIKSFGHNIDIIYDDSDLTHYDIIILPMAYILTKEMAYKIRTFMKLKKVLITTGPFGYVNNDDLCHLGGFPGFVQDILGIQITEIDALTDDDFSQVEYKNHFYRNYYFNELITPTTAKVIGTYTNYFYKHTPAITKNKYKNGVAYHLGTIIEENGLNTIFNDILTEAGFNQICNNKNLLVNEYSNKLYIFNFNNKLENVSINNKLYSIAPLDYLILEIHKEEICHK